MITNTVKNHINVIQYMRGLAALMVLLYHGSIFLGPYGTGIGGMLFGPAGNMGVDMFFIVSGLIMVITTKNFTGSSVEIITFAINRFSRILPTYIICSVAAFFIIWIFGGEFMPVERLIKSLLFIPTGGGFGPVYGWPALNVGWTLNYEVYFYIIFCISLFFGSKRYNFLFASIILIIYFAPMMSDRAINSQVATTYNFSFNYLNLMTNPIILLFLVGVAIGIIYLSSFKLSKHTSLLLCFSSLVMVCLQYIYKFRVDHGVSQWGLSIVPLVFSLVISTKSLRIPDIKALSWLGDISYSVYLVHPIILYVNISMMRAIGLGAYQKGPIALIFFAAISLASSVIIHKLIEKRLSNFVRGKLLDYFVGSKALRSKNSVSI